MVFVRLLFLLLPLVLGLYMTVTVTAHFHERNDISRGSLNSHFTGNNNRPQASQEAGNSMNFNFIT